MRRVATPRAGSITRVADRNQGMINRYPSLVCLRSFEAVARHLSFTRAAVELNITQTAVSHQIRKLEELLEMKLFIRIGNQVQLTEVAQEYYPTVRNALAQIALATERATRFDQENRLTIASAQGFAMKFLFPRLDEFRKRHPEIQIQIKALLSFESLARQDYDIAIRYGSGNGWPGWNSDRLTSEEIFPVHSPKLLCQHRLESPEDLAHHTAIRSSSPILTDDWPAWLRVAGVPDLRFKDEIVCDLLFTSLQAAVDGLGVAIGRRGVVELDLAAGRLIAPFDITLASNSGYFMLTAPERSGLPKVEAFRSWLLECYRATRVPRQRVGAA